MICVVDIFTTKKSPLLSDICVRVQWERYMRCDGSPDPAVQQDINTYISLWRDDPEVNVTALLKQNNFALQVCAVVNQLQFYKDKTCFI